MKIVELKCKNCGANLKVADENDIINCPYCQASYKLDDETQHIKYEDMENSGYEFEKGRIKAQQEIINNDKNADNKRKKFLFIFGIILIIFGIIWSAIVFRKGGTMNNTMANFRENADKRSFNSSFEMYDGTVQKIFVTTILDNVNSNNKKNKDKIVSVKYNGVEMTDSDEIIEIKKEFVDGKFYEVILDYDDDGYVNKVTIK